MQINITDVATAITMKRYIIELKQQEEHKKMQIFFNLFPFNRLIECDAINYELTKVLSEILIDFVPIEGFLADQNNSVVLTVDYILRNCTFLIKNAGTDYVLIALLNLLTLICKRLKKNGNDLSRYIDADRVCDILIALMKSIQPILVKSHAAKIVSEILTPEIVATKCDIMHPCITEIFNTLGSFANALDLMKIAVKILKANFTPGLTNFEFVFAWVEKESPQYLHKNTDEKLLVQLLKYTQIMCETNHQIYGFTRILLSRLDHLCEIIYIPKAQDTVKFILFRLLMDTCSLLNITWCQGWDHLKLQIQMLSQHQDWPTSDIDVFFLIAYLQYTHASLQWSSNEILQAIVRRVHTNAYIPPVVLKSMCLLFAALRSNSEFEVTSHLLLNHLKFLPLLITFHPAQLEWILRSAEDKFKVTVLGMWLRETKDDDCICHVCLDCKSEKTLVNYIVMTEDDITSKQRAIAILRNLKSSTCVIRSMMFEAVLKPELIGLLLQTKPAVPNNPQLCLHLAGFISAVLPLLVDGYSIQYACFFVSNLVIKFKTSPDYFLAVCNNPSTIRFLSKTTLSKEDEIASAAIRLLRTLTRLQARHKSSVERATQLDFCSLLRGSISKVSEALRLLFLVLKPRTAVPILRLAEEIPLGLYQKLHGIGIQGAAPISYRCMVMLLNNEEYLAHSSVNIVCIRMQCSQINAKFQPEFLDFLNIWLKKIHRFASWTVPEQDIRSYLKGQDPHKQVDEVMVLLNKLQL